MAKSKCNISFEVDYTSSKSITSATYSYKLKSSQNYSNPFPITPLPSSGDLINIPTDGLANGDYDLMVTLGSGSVTTSMNDTFKIGNCSGANISVDAGPPEQTFTELTLGYGTPILRKINNVGSSPTYGAHSTSGDFFRIKLTIENGASTNLNTCRLYYKKQSDANWYSDGSSVYNGDEVEVLFTNIMSQGELLQFKLGVYVNGTTTEIFSNVLSINYDELNSATEVQGYMPNQWQDLVATSQITPFTINLNGSVQNGGSSPTYLWEVVSKPTGAVCSFGNSANLATTFTADTFGTYKLRLSASNSAGQSASDEMIINLIQKASSSPTVLLRWDDNSGTEDRVCSSSVCSFTIEDYATDPDNDIVSNQIFKKIDNGAWNLFIANVTQSTFTDSIDTIGTQSYKAVVGDANNNTVTSNILSYTKPQKISNVYRTAVPADYSESGWENGHTGGTAVYQGALDFKFSEILGVSTGFIRLKINGDNGEFGLQRVNNSSIVINQNISVTEPLRENLYASCSNVYQCVPVVNTAQYTFEFSDNGVNNWQQFLMYFSM